MGVAGNSLVLTDFPYVWYVGSNFIATRSGYFLGRIGDLAILEGNLRRVTVHDNAIMCDGLRLYYAGRNKFGFMDRTQLECTVQAV